MSDPSLPSELISATQRRPKPTASGEELPRGTVTFLLTDVEGSTRLWEEAPETMRAALARHDALFETAILRHGGHHIRPRGEGDSRFAVFASAADSVGAASTIQRAFAAEAWPTPRPIRVRIGVHTGEAELRDGDYYGSAVNRCARLRGIGHGGQVLLSEATAALVRDDLPPGAMLLDLGEHRLKDLTRPERVYQLTAPGLATDLPPLASLDARPHNLPLQPTALLGRERDVAEIRALFEQGARLVTLTGPGGTGKTRLALQVAAELLDAFEHGVTLTELAPVTDPGLVLVVIAQALGIREIEGRSLLDSVVGRLSGRRQLVVLDNFEQVLDAATVIAELLRSCPALAVLVTSRAPLEIGAEHEWPVQPLALPEPGQIRSPEQLAQYPATALFVERAGEVRPGFTISPANAPAIAELCTRLDGLPLAIELAAARIRLLSPEAMVYRLGSGLDLLAGSRRDLPARQQTLRSAIAWSYDLLPEPEQRLFRYLSVFVGGFTLEAAAAVGGDDRQETDVLDLVGRLVAQSLVRADHEDHPEPRFRMLETIREFALERLQATGDSATVRGRHLGWCADFVERAVGRMGGPEQARWVDRLEAEHDNLRAALGWAERTGDVAGLGLRLASRLGRNFWTIRGHHREGRSWLARLLPFAAPGSAGRAAGLHAVGVLALRQNDYAAAGAVLDEALEIYRALSDRHGITQALHHLGAIYHHLGEHDAAQMILEESVAGARELGETAALGIALRNLADLMQDRGDHGRAVTHYEESLALARAKQIPHDVAYNLRGLGNVARVQGQYGRAEAYLRESLALLKSIQDRRCIPLTLEGLACITVGAGWAERAARLLGAAHAMQAKTGAPNPPSVAADYRRTEADARRMLGSEQFDRAWAEGGAMTLDEAVDLALAKSFPPGSHQELKHAVVAHAPGSRSTDVPLSARERDVVALIAAGQSNREIAERLVLSVRTVERHIENVYNRLGISGKAGRAIVTAYALRHGLTDPPTLIGAG